MPDPWLHVSLEPVSCSQNHHNATIMLHKTNICIVFPSKKWIHVIFIHILGARINCISVNLPVPGCTLYFTEFIVTLYPLVVCSKIRENHPVFQLFVTYWPSATRVKVAHQHIVVNINCIWRLKQEGDTRSLRIHRMPVAFLIREGLGRRCLLIM